MREQIRSRLELSSNLRRNKALKCILQNTTALHSAVVKSKKQPRRGWIRQTLEFLVSLFISHKKQLV